MPLSSYLAAEVAKYAFVTGSAAAEPTAWYVGLHSADPGLTGTSEISGSAYARQGSIAFTRTGGVVKNTGVAITFPTVTTTGYTVTHVSVWDASSTGNLLITGALAVPKTLAVGEALSFASDELILTVA